MDRKTEAEDNKGGGWGMTFTLHRPNHRIIETKPERDEEKKNQLAWS